jgi:phosphoribosylamine--glycine ligase
MASGGYPGNYEKGKPIRGLDDAAKLPDVKVFHAGTAQKTEMQSLRTAGAFLGVTALGKDLKAAQAAAYAAVEKIHFDGAHFRRDIGAKAVFARRRSPKKSGGRNQRGGKHADHDE